MTESHRPHILVIDDAQPVLNLYGEILGMEGYQVSLSRHPRSGIDEIKQTNVDLIILDLVFKGENLGVPLVKAVKVEAKTAHIPVVVCTGAIRVADEAEADLARHGVALIRKPFDIDDLLATVHDGLHQCGQPLAAHRSVKTFTGNAWHAASRVAPRVF